MAYKHGVYVSEAATSVLPPVTVDAGIPMVVGTAPVAMADASNVNRLTMVSTYAEAVAAFGYVPPALDAASGLKKYDYSICEAVYSCFALYGVSPLIVVNVLDPARHRKSCSATEVEIDINGTGTVDAAGIIPDTFVLSSVETPEEEEGGESQEGEELAEPIITTYTRGTDYEIAFDDEGKIVVSGIFGIDGECRIPTATKLTVEAMVTDPSAVTADDIIGGVSADGTKRGWELIDDVFPKLGILPGTLIAPGYSENPSVAAVMAAKCVGINGLFKAVSAIDIPADAVKQYSAAYEWKNTRGVSSTHQIACWPLLSLDGTAFHMSTALAGLMALTDSENGDVPYVSPSNKSFHCTATVLADGSEVWLNNETASYLNGQGIVTAQCFIGGWKAWGSRTACYPGNTDVKDAFIPVRRMFNWLGNTLIQTFWQRVDYPLNKRQVQTITDSANIWLNGLAARQYILGGRVEFNEEENPVTALLDGIATFHVYVTPPSPNREIDFVLEYDANYLNSLFA